MLIVAAGGGFKTVLSDSGVAQVIADAAEGLAHLGAAPRLADRGRHPAGHRLGDGGHRHRGGHRGAAGAPTLDQQHLSLLVLAIGAGSLFFSHVNDAGFWLVKEYFGLTVGQTIKSWSVMETVISVLGLIFVLILGAIV